MMKNISNPRLWLLVFGSANILFGLLLIIGGGAENIVSTLGSDAADEILMAFAKDMHEALGVLWAAFGALVLAAGIAFRGSAAKKPAVFSAIVGSAVQTHHIIQIASGGLPVGYLDAGISLILIACLFVSGVVYKGDSS